MCERERDGVCVRERGRQKYRVSVSVGEEDRKIVCVREEDRKMVCASVCACMCE